MFASPRNAFGVCSILLTLLIPELHAATVQLEYGILERSELFEGYVANSPEKPVVVIDLDGTVVSSGTVTKLVQGLGMVFPFFFRTVARLPLAPETISMFSDNYNIVYMTARGRQIVQGSLDWLDANGFPDAPLFYQDRSLSISDLWAEPEFRLEFKTEAVGYVIEQGLTAEIGIGDQSTDIKAYSDNGLRSILIIDNYGDKDLEETLDILGLPNTIPLLDTAAFGGLEFVTVGNEDAWTNIGGYVSS